MSLNDRDMNQAAHFTKLCSEKKDVKMLLFLQNGDSHLADASKQVTSGYARFMQAMATCVTPKVSIITDHQQFGNLLCPQAFQPHFLFRWPEGGFGNQSAVRCSANLWDDGVIKREDTRRHLSQLIPILKPFENDLEPVFRM